MLRSADWLDGARARARDLLDQGQSIDQAVEMVGLQTDEVEDIYIASRTERG